jgi:hypothetical protein
MQSDKKKTQEDTKAEAWRMLSFQDWCEDLETKKQPWDKGPNRRAKKDSISRME